VLVFLTKSSLPALDFTGLISNLDNTASEIVTYQRDSTVQRKDLAQKTKDFRKLDDTTKLTEIKALLKGETLTGSMRLGSVSRLICCG
jgi:hypothetical protein